MKVRIIPTKPWRRKRDFMVYIGPYAARFILRRDDGRFANGRKWFSGWHRWKDYA